MAWLPWPRKAVSPDFVSTLPVEAPDEDRDDCDAWERHVERLADAGIP